MPASEKKSECPYATSCHFYAMTDVNVHSEVLRERYCFDVYSGCEIFKRHKSGGRVSITTFPDGERKLG